MPDPVTIRYQLMDGRDVEVQLHRPGHSGRWVLDLEITDGDWTDARHQHAIAGTPEVTVG